MPKTDTIEDKKVKEILGDELFTTWVMLNDLIKSQYDMDEEWHTANKGKSFELKYRRGGKTLVSLFPNYLDEGDIGVMIIFGKEERSKFEGQKDVFSKYTISTYDEAKTFHDGKWVMFKAPSSDLEKDLLAMLATKRKPNKK